MKLTQILATSFSTLTATLTATLAAIVLGSFVCSATAFARGPSVSGGVPPAPRGVVIQAHAVQGAFDETGIQVALTMVGTHVATNRVLAFAQRDEAQANDRKYLCIEYRDYADFLTATSEFKNALVSHPTLEVVSNSFCR